MAKAVVCAMHSRAVMPQLGRHDSRSIVTMSRGHVSSACGCRSQKLFGEEWRSGFSSNGVGMVVDENPVSAWRENRGNVAILREDSSLTSEISVMSTFRQTGKLTEAIQAVIHLGQQGFRTSIKTYLWLLQECIKRRDLDKGKEVHALLVRHGYGRNRFLGSYLIRMYTQCGSLSDARAVFDKMSVHDVFSWTAIISGYVQHKLCTEAIKLYARMQEEGVEPNNYTYVSVLKACTSMAAFEEGKAVHAKIKKAGFESDHYIANTLIDLYAKCGALAEAREVFEKLESPDVVSWTALIAGYALHGHQELAFSLFSQMQEEGTEPNSMTLVKILKSCTLPSDLKQGRLIHEFARKSCYRSDLFVGTALVDMYAKCGDMQSARGVFDEITEQDVVLWNALLAGYVQHGCGEEALNMFHRMQCEAIVKPDLVTFISALKACVCPPNMEQGRLIHNLLIKCGHMSDAFVRSTLIDMYCKCGSLKDALEVFEKTCARDVVACTAMISGYVQHGQSENALHLFEQMQREGLKPDKVTLISTLKACMSPANLKQGKMLHTLIKQGGFESDEFVQSTLVIMYAKCGSTADAIQVFNVSNKKNVVTWNAMLAGYLEVGLQKQAMQLFDEMECAGVVPDAFTFATVLKGCVGLAALEQGRSIHTQIMSKGVLADVFLQNSLITMYAKCGSIQDAHVVFNQMAVRDVVSWTAMISAYAEHGQYEDAYALYEKMQQEGIVPNVATFISVLKSCSSPAALEQGRRLHAEIFQSVSESNVYLGNSLVDMYSRCGSLDGARQVFENMPHKDMVSWSSMITGCVQHGKHDEALSLFREMESQDLSPNSTAFIKIIKACTG